MENKKRDLGKNEHEYYLIDGEAVAVYVGDKTYIANFDEVHQFVNYFMDKHNAHAKINDLIDNHERIGLNLYESKKSRDDMWYGEPTPLYPMWKTSERGDYQVIAFTSGEDAYSFYPEVYDLSISDSNLNDFATEFNFDEEMPKRYFDLQEGNVLVLTDDNFTEFNIKDITEKQQNIFNETGVVNSLEYVIEEADKYDLKVFDRSEFKDKFNLEELFEDKRELFLVEDYSNGKFVEAFIDKDNGYVYNLGIDKGNEFTNLKEDAEFVKKQMEFMLNSLSDTINNYDKGSRIDESFVMKSDDAIVDLKVRPFESLLTSKSVQENKNTINKHVIFEPLEVDIDDDFKSNDLDYIFYDDCVNDRYFGYTAGNEARFQEDFKKSEEMRFLGFESDVMDIHNRYIKEKGYDAFVEL